MTSRLCGRHVRGLAGVAALSVPLALVACTPVHPGAAAIVGSHAISVDTLQRLTNRVLAAADATTRPQIAADANALARLQRTILGRVIDTDLLTAAGRTRGITVSAGEIDTEQAQLAQQAGGESQLQQQAVLSGIPPGELRSVLSGLVVGSKLAEAVVADVAVTPAQLQAAYQQNIDQFDQVHVAHILVTTKALADQILRRVKSSPSSFAALAAQYSQDTTTGGAGGDLGLTGRSRLEPTFADAVFAAKPGSFIEVHSSLGYHVVHVIAHPVESLVSATPQLRAAVLQTVSDQRVAALLTQVGHDLHITVNPRYGRWDLKNRDVAAPPDDLSKPVSTPTPAPTIPTGTGQPPSG